MTLDRKRLIKNILINSAVVLLALNAIVSIVNSFMFNQDVHASHMSDFSLGFVMLMTVWNLFLRKRFAWRVAIITLVISLSIYFQPLYRVWGLGARSIIDICVMAYILLILLVFQNSFKKRYTKRSIRTAYIFFGVSVSALIAGIFISDTDDYMDEIMNLISGYTITRTEAMISIVICISLVLAFYMALRPVVWGSTVHKTDKMTARRLVNKYGINPTSYLTLEPDKFLYFGKDVEGVIPYGLISGVAIVLGDPICAREDFTEFLSEWKEYCRDQEYSCAFLGATDEFMDTYKMLGYGSVKCGEEARFELETMSLSGKKKAKLRMNLNHANAAGLETFEYKPLEKRDEDIEHAIRAISKEWLSGKKSGKLGFTVGDVNLDNPLDRRYFYCKDPSGRIVAFDVFIPFMENDGYVADVTRRLMDAPGGVTEKLFYDAMMVFKEEGYHWGSVGLSPLANVLGDENEGTMTAKLLNLMYEKGNAFYGFKSLHGAKERYGPDIWVPGYFIYSGKTLTPRVAMALVTIQNTSGKLDFIFGLIRELRKKKTIAKQKASDSKKDQNEAPQQEKSTAESSAE